MNIKIIKDPQPYLLIENFISLDWQNSLIKSFEANTFKKSDFIAASSTTENANVKERIVDTSYKFLDSMKMDHEHEFVQYFLEQFYSDNMLTAFDEIGDLLYKTMHFIRKGKYQVSAYGEGGFYKTHRDYALVSANLFMSYENRVEFEGGGLLLNNELIPFKPRTLVVFAGMFPHSVPEVTGLDQDFLKRRFSFQYWPTFCNEHN
jgi:Rps23 Pro-64 3,4-dihydroxylase Tpa1-like proline 4-hydroxylase